MATIYDIIKGINQAAANAYDGSHDEKYAYDKTARKVGLKREEGDAILDSRVMDGFSVRFHGQNLVVNYHAEYPIADAHGDKFEGEVKERMANIVKYLKKEYKNITGDTVTLKADGDAKILVQSMSRIRCWLEATQQYKIGGLKDTDKPGSSEERLDKAVKDWLAIGKDKYPKAKKPDNVSRKSS